MPSFDIVSEIDKHEVENAVQQAHKEVSQRYDFRDTDTSIESKEDGVFIRSASKDRVDAARSVLYEKWGKRSLSLKSLDAGQAQPSGKNFNQMVRIKEGIDKDAAKKIVKMIKDEKFKVQASIQGDTVRVSGKKRDDLQTVIAFLKASDVDLPLQYKNFRD